MNKGLLHSVLILLIVGLVACSTESTDGESSVSQPKFPEKESKYAHLLKQFKSIEPDTLHISSTGEYGRFKGAKLNRSDCRLLPIDTRDMDYIMDYGIYACYKFPIDSNYVGLIIRTPSIYESSSIDLFVWDVRKDEINYGFQLAQSVGDAGVSSMKTALLSKIGKDYFSFIYDHETEADVEDTTGNSDLHWDFYYDLRWNKQQFDTVSTDQKLLRFKYRKFIEKYGRQNQ